jgi:hypothetical protein
MINTNATRMLRSIFGRLIMGILLSVGALCIPVAGCSVQSKLSPGQPTETIAAPPITTSVVLKGERETEPATNLPQNTSGARSEIVNIRSTTELDSELLKVHMSFAAGGASGCYNYGQNEICEQIISGSISVYIGGIYSTADQYQEAPFWQTKYSPCKERLELGDMAYFVARGFQHGESVKFSISGPLGSEEHVSVVNHETLVNGGCEPEEEYEAARFSWVASPLLGVGEYTLTVSNSSESVSLKFAVHEGDRPNFGARFGSDGHPLLLKGENVQLVFVGFPPGHTITTLLYEDPFSVTDIFIKGRLSDLLVAGDSTTFDSVLVGFIETKVNDSGFAIQELVWSDNLPSGMYSLLVPELIPSDSSGAYSPDEGRALYSIQFAVQKD